MEKKKYKLDLQAFAEPIPEPTPEQQPKPTVDSLLEAMNELKLSTVSKEKYDEIMKDNERLVREVTNNRQVVTTKKEEPTHQDIIKRCEERTMGMDDGTSYTKVKSLVENYRDMKTLGMDVSNVDESIVESLEEIIAESKGDPTYFKSLMEAKIKVK